MIYIYVPEKGFHLTERLLQEIGTTSSILLCHPSKLDWCKTLVSKFTSITQVTTVQEYFDSRVHSTEDSITLPISIGQLKLKFVPRAEIPNLKPYYEEIELLHRIGFRNFRLYTLFGARVIRIEHLLYNFEKKHEGEIGVVVANGPSLRKIDISKAKEHVTLGSNRIFQGFKEWGFSFNYWAIEDRLQIEEYYSEYHQNLTGDTVNFYPFEYLPFLNYPNGCPLNHYYNPPEPRFSLTSKIVEHGFTVTHMLLQLAAIMGCNPIYIVGLDHSYNIGEFDKEYGSFRPDSAQPEKPESAQFWDQSLASTNTHFSNDYTKGNKRFVPPRPKAAELSYEKAYSTLSNAGIKVFNASPGTMLDVFPKVTVSEFHAALSK